MTTEKSWCEDDLITEDARLVMDSLICGIMETEVSEDTGVDNGLIKKWLLDPEFVDFVNQEKKNFQKKIKETFEIKSLMRSKKDLYKAFSIKCEINLTGCHTKKQRLSILEKYEKEFRKVFLKTCEPPKKVG